MNHNTHTHPSRSTRGTRLGSLFGVAALTLSASLTGCAAAQKVGDVAKSSAGVFAGDHGREVWIVHPGEASAEDIAAGFNDDIDRATREGAHVKAFILTGGSAASMTEVKFSSAAGSGDFKPTGSNDIAWKKRAKSYAKAAKVDLARSVRSAQLDDTTGADLVGAVARATRAVEDVSGSGPLRVILHTGGGVQRTEALDLVAAGTDSKAIADLAEGLPPLGKEGIDLHIKGVAEFGAGPTIDPEFADGVREFWTAICTSPTCNLD